VVVQCQTCQARFRVADDKVTERGVRVRCTSCRTVFLVRKDGEAVAAASQAATGETVMGMAPLSISSLPPPRQSGPLPGVRVGPAPGAPVSQPPRNGAPKRAPAPPASQPPPAGAADDPFGMDELTGDQPRVSAPPPAAPPPALARPAASVPPAARAQNSSGPPAARAAAAQAPAARSLPPQQRSLPPQAAPPGMRLKAKADLSALDIDLEGPAPARSAPPVAPRSSLPPPAPPSSELQPAAIGKLTRPARPAPAAAQAPSRPPPSRPPPPPPVFDDLDIEAGEAKATPPPPVESASAAGPQSAETPSSFRDPFAGLDLSGEEGKNPPPLRPSDPALARVPPPSQPPPSEQPALEPPPEDHQAHAAQEAPAAPHSPKTRRQIVSGALTGLVGAAIAVALALGPSTFSEGGLQRLLGLGAGDLVAITEASGFYDTVSGRPVYFVRGRVENRGKHPSGPVRVVALLVGDSGITARAESVAGIEPTPEDVYGLKSVADANALIKALAKSRTGDRRLPPGGSLPFFALFPEAPASLTGQRIQVRLEAGEVAGTR
jgi:predicted Zn finger-like uncharacterized protein